MIEKPGGRCVSWHNQTPYQQWELIKSLAAFFLSLNHRSYFASLCQKSELVPDLRLKISVSINIWCSQNFRSGSRNVSRLSIRFQRENQFNRYPTPVWVILTIIFACSLAPGLPRRLYWKLCGSFSPQVVKRFNAALASNQDTSKVIFRPPTLTNQDDVQTSHRRGKMASRDTT